MTYILERLRAARLPFRHSTDRQQAAVHNACLEAERTIEMLQTELAFAIEFYDRITRLQIYAKERRDRLQTLLDTQLQGTMTGAPIENLMPESH